VSERPGRRRPFTVFLLIWLVLLVASHIVRRLRPERDGPRPGQSAVLLTAVKDTTLLSNRTAVRLAYQEWGPDSAGPAQTVILVHGSPGDGEAFNGLGPLLAIHYHVIAPDLPGFGGSSITVPDYSIRAHARYLLQLLDSLHLADAHLVGFSMGGGVVEEMARQAPGRIRSLTLLSGIGIQEAELLGDYYLNHTIHGLQLGALWFLREGTPHFGWLDDAMLSVPYARNFYDTDQRPLRGVLSSWQGPMLILHGLEDPLVPIAAAREHARIVPQAEVVLFPGDHFMTFMHPEVLAGPMRDFLGRVDRGEGVTRARAEPARLAAAAEPFDPSRTHHAAGFGLFIAMSLIALATLVSEDLTCIGTGIMVARGSIGFLPGMVACLIGIFMGDVIFFALGRLLGRPVLERPPLSWIVRAKSLNGAVAWFKQRGPVLVFVTRFLPGFRVPVYVAAGVLHTGAWTFVGWFFLAALVWTPALVWLSARFGQQMVAWLRHTEGMTWPALLIAGTVVFLIVRFGLPMFTYRGRRLLVSLWRRLTRWEFWPMWAFYPPIALYVLYLGIRYRALTLFTAVNPCIPGGGFVGESKAAILNGLAHTDLVAPWMLIPASIPLPERMAQAEAFMRRHGFSYPVVLKPDTGERGSGVKMARSAADVAEYLSQAGGDILIQQYVEGHEYGVFYYRYPDQSTGRIFSITDKRLPVVTGDGIHTLEELILADERAVCMAGLYLERHQSLLHEIPPAGVAVRLGDLGNHSQGALFLDGAELNSPALEAEIDRLSRGYAGFYFGRFDLRVPAEDDLRAGRNITILELNGASSEATHIYDPQHDVFAAWRTLREQWRILFRIADQNRRAGIRPLGLGGFLRAWGRHREQVAAHAQG
jgi:pimeloyl-ACP methyl ester carboxylesterase/membrane protein DedA with SNARE-associated domain